MLKIVGGLFLALVNLLLLNVAFALINTPSNFSVLGGVVVLIGMVAEGCFLYRRYLHKSAKKAVRAMSRVASTPILVMLLVTAALMTSGCYTKISPGNVGIKVNNYGSERGVSDYPLQTGAVWYNPFTQSVFEYPTYVQTRAWTKNPKEGSVDNEEISFNSKDGMVFTADISLSYQLDKDKVPSFYVKFRSDDLDMFTNGFLHNVARDAFNELATRYSVDEIYGGKKEELLTIVVARVNERVEPFGVHIVQFGYLGAPRPPQIVIDAINGKIQATQDALRVQNEVQKATAEAQKTVATAEGAAKSAIAKAQGDAEANRLLTASITPQLLEWRRLEIAQQTVAKWNGQRPTVEGAGSNMLFTLPLPAHN